MRRKIFAAILSLCSVTAWSSARAIDFEKHTYRAGHGPNGGTAGDFNGDGIPDLVIANACGDKLCETNGVVKVLLGNGDGTFREGKQSQSAVNGNSVAIAAADFNNDGKLDVAVVNTGVNVNGDVSVLLGKGDGTFGPPMPNSPGGVPLFVATGDFNHDGNMDLAVTLNNPGEVSVLLGNGDGTFKPAVTYPVEIGPQDLAVADVNHDGIPDLIVVNECGHVQGCRQGTVSVLLGKGDGTFKPQKSYFVGIFPLTVAVADLNNDGKPDLVLNLPCGTDGTCTSNGGVGILLGNGDGTFQNVATYIGTGTDTARVGVGDFNGDGNVDVVALNYQTSSLTLFPGKGNGTLKPGLSLAVGGDPNSVTVGDFNADGKPDMAIVNQTPHTVSVLINASRR